MTDQATGMNAPVVFDINEAAIAEVAEQFKDVDAYTDFEAAKIAKKTLTKMRGALTDAHKAAKASALEYGRRCDAEKNKLLTLIHKIEDPITDQLEEIKNEALAIEARRVEAIQDHIYRLTAYAADRFTLSLDELEERRANLAAETIDEGRYQELTESASLVKQEADLKLRLAIDAEKTRIQDEARQAAIEAENRELREKLAKQEEEQRQRDAAAATERADRERKEREERDAKDAADRAAREAAEAKEREAREKLEAENRALREAQERQDREAREKAEREARELIEQAEREAAELRAAEQAPDQIKLLAYADMVDELLKNKPTLSTEAAKEVLMQATAMLIEVAYDIRKLTEEMK